MIRYGNYKRGSSKLHPHDKCGVCSEKTISKKAARRIGKEDMEKEYRIDPDHFVDVKYTKSLEAMIKRCQEINRLKEIEEVYQRLSAMPPKEFRKELEKHKSGDIAKMLLYSKAVLLKPFDEWEYL